MAASDTIRSYKDLNVWKLGMDLAEAAYRHTANFPREEAFGMTAQIRRAAASIPANIAEGYGRENTGSYIQFLRIAQGSLKELETHLMLAERVGLLAPEPKTILLDQAESISKMLRNFIRSLQATA
jgi:four helix bundle protein